MNSIDLIRKIHNALRDYNKALNDYDTTTNELANMQYELETLVDKLNAYSYEKCRTFYTHYKIVENCRGYCLGADLREKR